MRKYKLLGAIAVASLITGTSLMAASDDTGEDTNYGLDSYAIGESVSFGTRAGQLSYPASVKNTMIGFEAGMNNHEGDENTYVGYRSGFSQQNKGSSNVAIGTRSGRNGNGDSNVMIGKNTGRDANASKSIYIGDGAGSTNTRDNTLIIESFNENELPPLIYGEFDNRMLRVNGTMEINATVLQKEDVDIYAFMRIRGENTLPQEMNWMMGIAKPTDDSAQRFYVRNMVTEQSPFAIIGKAQDQTLVVGSAEEGMESNVGIGTGVPTAKLDVRGNVKASFEGDTDMQALKMMEISVNNTNTNALSDVGFSMENTREDFAWTFRTWEDDSGFAIAKVGNGGIKEFKLHDIDPTDPTSVVLTLANGAWCDGVWHNTSSRNMKQDIKPLDTKAALEAFKKLKPVTYVYKANPTDPKVGFIAEDVPELVADPKHKSLSSMDMVALLTKVVQEQDREMNMMKEEIAELKKMKQKIAQIESLLTNIALDTSNSKEEKISLNNK